MSDLISFWKEVGTVVEIDNVKTKAFYNDRTRIKKIFLKHTGKDVNTKPLYYEVELDSAHNKHYIFLDFDLSNKLKQRMISDFDLNVFRSLDVIYLERSFHGGLHFLVCVDDQVVKTYNKIEKKVEIDCVEYSLFIEFLRKCLVSPSINYTTVFRKDEEHRVLNLTKLETLIGNICLIIDEKSKNQIKGRHMKLWEVYKKKAKRGERQNV